MTLKPISACPTPEFLLVRSNQSSSMVQDSVRLTSICLGQHEFDPHQHLHQPRSSLVKTSFRISSSVQRHPNSSHDRRIAPYPHPSTRHPLKRTSAATSSPASGSQPGTEKLKDALRPLKLITQQSSLRPSPADICGAPKSSVKAVWETSRANASHGMSKGRF